VVRGRSYIIHLIDNVTTTEVMIYERLPAVHIIDTRTHACYLLLSYKVSQPLSIHLILCKSILFLFFCILYYLIHDVNYTHLHYNLFLFKNKSRLLSMFIFQLHIILINDCYGIDHRARTSIVFYTISTSYSY